MGDIYNELQAQLIGLNSKLKSLEVQQRMANEQDVGEIEQQKQEVEEQKQAIEEVQNQVAYGNMTIAEMVKYERMAQRFLRDQRAQHRGTPVASSASSSRTL